MRKVDVLLSVVMVAMSYACGGVESPDDASSREQISTEENFRTVEQVSTSFRSDYYLTIEPPGSPWGDWRQTIYCNPGSWAIGYMLQVEAYRGSEDDTGLNSVKLLCQTPTGLDVEWISGWDNGWGTWGNPVSCSGAGNFIKSARLRVEGYQGSRDDTAANDVEMGCYNGGTIHTTNGNGWGEWYDWRFCPANTAVCGLTIRFESYRGSSDDTGMNALQLHCCQL